MVAYKYIKGKKYYLESVYARKVDAQRFAKSKKSKRKKTRIQLVERNGQRQYWVFIR